MASQTASAERPRVPRTELRVFVPRGFEMTEFLLRLDRRSHRVTVAPLSSVAGTGGIGNQRTQLRERDQSVAGAGLSP